jgi:hypothetical protein
MAKYNGKYYTYETKPIDEIINQVKQYGTKSWIWDGDKIRDDVYVCDIFPILEDLKEFEIELSDEEFANIIENGKADNTYNWGANISNDLDFRYIDGIDGGCVIMVHLAGDVRSNYSDYFAIEDIQDLFDLESTYQTKDIDDRYSADMEAFREGFDVYDQNTSEIIGECYDIEREDVLEWIKQNTSDDLEESSKRRYMSRLREDKDAESYRKEVERLNNIAGEANSKLGKLLEQYGWLFDTTYNYKLYDVVDYMGSDEFYEDFPEARNMSDDELWEEFNVFCQFEYEDWERYVSDTYGVDVSDFPHIGRTSSFYILPEYLYEERDLDTVDMVYDLNIDFLGYGSYELGPDYKLTDGEIDYMLSDDTYAGVEESIEAFRDYVTYVKDPDTIYREVKNDLETYAAIAKDLENWINSSVESFKSFMEVNSEEF